MIGGAYLCFEGYEKVHTIFAGHGQEVADDENTEEISPEQLEKIRIDSAVRTDFILSAEIVAISYSLVADLPLVTKIAVLASVAIAITVGVYGFVGLVVKADDFGVWLARRYTGLLRKIGRGIVRAMPGFLLLLGYIGTVAMLWVGAGIIAHGIPPLEHGLAAIHAAFGVYSAAGWLAQALVSAIGGLAFGWIVALAVGAGQKLFGGTKADPHAP
jgi:predicted DNA repair protein MutK